MLYFALGLIALILALSILKGFAGANPAVLARQMRVIAGSSALAGAAVLGVRGALSYAIPLAMFGSWLIWGSGGPRWGGFPRSSQRTPGQASRVRTDYLEMELEHDTGAMRGRVLKGRLTGRTLENLTPAELAALWQECRFADPRSAQLIEAYLDRAHPSWREDMARAESPPGRGPRMSREEALEVLGLEPGASEDDIRRAHRELMLKLHPDRGGSDYLAAKINEAKAVLLAR